jgi:hypothetical protein
VGVYFIGVHSIASVFRRSVLLAFGIFLSSRPRRNLLISPKARNDYDECIFPFYTRSRLASRKSLILTLYIIEEDILHFWFMFDVISKHRSPTSGFHSLSLLLWLGSLTPRIRKIVSVRRENNIGWHMVLHYVHFVSRCHCSCVPCT